jgi:hypothetical protein
MDVTFRIASLSILSLVAAACATPPPVPAEAPHEASSSAPVASAEPAPPAASSAPAASVASSGPAASAPVDVDGANFKEANYTGSKKLYFHDISCKSTPALKGLDGLGAVANGFEGKEVEIKKCLAANVKARVTFSTAGGKMTKVKAAGADETANKCLAAALEGASTKAPDATCALTVDHH